MLYHTAEERIFKSRTKKRVLIFLWETC